MSALPIAESEFSADSIRRLRLGVEDFLRAKGRVKDLDIEPNRPASGTPFAFIAVLPTIRSQHLWYRCSYCQHERKFGEGRLAFCGDLKLRFVGNKCWRKHIAKEAWTDARDDFRTFKTKQQFDLVRDELGPVLFALSRDLRIYVDGNFDTLKQIETFGGRLSRLIPELWKYLNQGRRAGNILVVERMLTDREKEVQKQFSGLTKSAGTAGVRVERIHTLQGTRILDDMNVVTPLIEGLRSIQNASERFKAAGWDNLPPRTFSKTLKAILEQIDKGLSAIASAAMLRNEAMAFFNPSHIQGIGRWGADHDAEIVLDGELVVGEKAISLVTNDGEKKISLIEPRGLPEPPSVAKMTLLLNKLR